MDISNIYQNTNDASNNDINNENLITTIMNQTDYDYTTAKNKLVELDNDYIKVIKNYLNINTSKNTNKKSLNQQIYKEFRTFFEP